MSFSEQVPSTDWVTLTHAGEDVAEAWFMPDGDSFTVVFLVPRHRLDGADADRPVTVGVLLEAAAVPPDAVESWRLGDASHAAADGAGLELSQPLPAPPADEDQLTVYVRLKPQSRAAAGDTIGDADIPPEKWHALEALWKAILGLEASIDTSRLSLDGVRSEMEAAFKKSLSVEEKLCALQSDVAQWNKAKGRIHYALPKVREFIHRATWALAVPERKQLEEVVRAHVETRTPFPGVDRVREQMEHFQKDRQVLFAQGNAVYQECRGILAEIQRALGTLQRNAADRARAKRSAGREKGKHF